MASDCKEPIATNGDFELILLKFPDFKIEGKNAVISQELWVQTLMRMNRMKV